MEVTISLTRYNEPPWLLKEALDSLAAQQGVTAKVLFLDQQAEDDGLKAYCQRLSSDDVVFEHASIPARSLSFARNAAIERCDTEIILFIDPDAIAAPGWAIELVATLKSPSVSVAGGKIVPLWHRKPLWIMKAGIVLDQYSMLDLGDETRAVNRVVGANFGLNLKNLAQLAHFDETLGRREGKLFSGEESELCRRAKNSGKEVLYNGNAVVKHQVLPERISYHWILRRMYFAGIARATVGGAPNPSKKISWWDYLALLVVLPPYVAGYTLSRLKLNTHNT
jgi:glycosyltransferase involved in cell wall biosynthesis